MPDQSARLFRPRLHQARRTKRVERGGGVKPGVGDAHPFGPRPRGRAVEPPQVVRARTGRVFGDEEHGEPLPHGPSHAALDLSEQPVEIPTFGDPPQRRRTDEQPDLERHAGAGGDLGDRPQVVLDGAGCALQADRQPCPGHLGAQLADRTRRLPAGAREADVCGADAERHHCAEQREPLVHRRVPNRGRLQPVAQRSSANVTRALAHALSCVCQS
jgi:hypothetical protein